MTSRENPYSWVRQNRVSSRALARNRPARTRRGGWRASIWTGRSFVVHRAHLVLRSILEAVSDASSFPPR